MQSIWLMKFYAILLSISLLTLFACKEEIVEPATKTELLSNQWIFDKAFLNDTTELTFGDGMINYYEYKENGEYILRIDAIYDDDEQFVIGSWEFYNFEEYLIRYTPEYIIRTLSFPEKTDTVKIVKLEETKFWISREFSSDIVEFRYIPR